jgi:hypothetical protein
MYTTLVVSELIKNRKTTEVKFTKAEDKNEKGDIYASKQ